MRKDFDGVKKNWVVTAIDNNRTKKEKGNGSSGGLMQEAPTVTSETAPDNPISVGKDSGYIVTDQTNDGSYWNVYSGGILRKGYSNKKETVAKIEPQQPNNAVSTGSSLSADDQGGISPTEPNGKPTVSESKDSGNIGNDQTNGGEISSDSGEIFSI